MAHQTQLGGTSYEISGGTALQGGVSYAISKGRAMVGGTLYEIAFQKPFLLEIENESYNQYELSYVENGVEKTQEVEWSSTTSIWVDDGSYITITFLFGQGYTPSFWNDSGQLIEEEWLDGETCQIAASDCLRADGDGYLRISA